LEPKVGGLEPKVGGLEPKVGGLEPKVGGRLQAKPSPSPPSDGACSSS
jgi:hypothetical protein